MFVLSSWRVTPQLAFPCRVVVQHASLLSHV
jgi:hypothetical protein